MAKPFPQIEQEDDDKWSDNFLDEDALQEVVDNAADYTDKGNPPTKQQVANVIAVLVDLGYLDLTP